MAWMKWLVGRPACGPAHALPVYWFSTWGSGIFSVEYFKSFTVSLHVSLKLPNLKQTFLCREMFDELEISLLVERAKEACWSSRQRHIRVEASLSTVFCNKKILVYQSRHVWGSSDDSLRRSQLCHVSEAGFVVKVWTRKFHNAGLDSAPGTVTFKLWTSPFTSWGQRDL